MIKDELFCVLIGLLGAINNNGKREKTDELIIKAILNKCDVSDIESEKDLISPSCKSCASPCGNTSALDINKYRENLNDTKRELLEVISKYVKKTNTVSDLIIKALMYIAYDLKESEYLKLIKEIKNA